MREIIDWLIKIESAASELYRKASDYFRDDPELSEFLANASEDEKQHCEIMENAAQYLNNHAAPPADFILDEIFEKIENEFGPVLDKIESRTATREDLLQCVINTELSEWNDIFLCIVNALKAGAKPVSFEAISIQNHKRSVEHFFESSPEGKERIASYKKLAPVWEENILIVDDSDFVSECLRILLNRDGNIDIAKNGEEGLLKLRKKFYKLVISDICMPVMNGIDFFKNAVREFPGIDSRFLFYTGEPYEDVAETLAGHDARFLSKPACVNAIRENAFEIITNQSEYRCETCELHA